MEEKRESAVKHNYSLTIRDAKFGTAFALLMKTLPYAMVRFGILFLVSIVTIIWAFFTFGIGGFLAGKVHGVVGWVWIIAGCGVYGYLWHFIVRYTLYMIKCGHISVLTELITKGKIGNGNESMFEYGKKTVKEKFTQVNVLFAMDLLIDGVIKSFNRTLNWIANIIPIPGVDKIMQIVNAIIYSATTYIDETIFSYILAREEKNPWKGGIDGLIYYCQNTKEMLKTAVWIVILDKVLTFVLWMIILIPTVLLMNVIGKGAGMFAFFTAVLIALNLRSAFLQPLFLIMVMTKFHVSVENQEINLEWESKLDNASKKFGEMKDKALQWKDEKMA